MATREINIDELQVGMYVTKLDVSWLDSPFLVHQIRIKTTDDIAKLRAARVKRVVIDASKTLIPTDPVFVAETSVLTEADGKPAPEPEERSTTEVVADSTQAAEPESPRPATLLTQELSDAQRLASKAKQTLQRVMDDALSGKAIDKATVTPIITDTLASLSRNDQALLTLMHLERHGGARQVTHAFSVLSLCMAVGHQMNLPREHLELLGLAALLHDVGWVRLPVSLFGKGRPYTPKEQKLVDQHVSLSLSILGKSPDLPKEVSLMVSSHHERLDATAPRTDTPPDLLATTKQILAAVEAYDSTLHGLADQPAMQPTAALRSLFVQARTGQFDLYVMGQLVHVLGIYPLTSVVELNTGEIGIVIELKRPHSLQPVVKVCYTADKQPLQPPLIVDLSNMDSEGQSRRIERVLNPDSESVDPDKILKIDLPAI